MFKLTQSKDSVFGYGDDECAYIVKVLGTAYAHKFRSFLISGDVDQPNQIVTFPKKYVQAVNVGSGWFALKAAVYTWDEYKELYVENVEMKEV